MKRTSWMIVVAICGATLPTFVSGPASRKEIALTFDDEIRPKVLSGDQGLLAALHGNPATFFALGYQAKERPELFRMLIARGYEIENHTWRHENLVNLERSGGVEGVLQNIERTSSAIAAACGKRPRYFRPPYWAINPSIKAAISAKGYRVMTIGDPDINSLDYDDYAYRRPASALQDRVLRDIRAREKRGIYRHVLVFHEVAETPTALAELVPIFMQEGYHFVTLEKFFEDGLTRTRNGAAYAAEGGATQDPTAMTDDIRAPYLSIDNLSNERKIAALEKIFTTTDANALIVDYKVDRPVPDREMKNLVAHFKKLHVYLIARIVEMQDSFLVRAKPELALRRHDGSLWYSGQEEWHRYWVDPASPEVLQYNILVAERAVDLGFDEINFDYIRFPTDGAMRDIVYPAFNPATMRKSEVMDRYFRDLTTALRNYDPRIRLSVDIFGAVAAHGAEQGIGQEFAGSASYFDVMCPMAYPSHYQCGEFGFHDPTAHPYEVYLKTLAPAVAFLKERGSRATLRPWVQAFSITSIYGCGPHLSYGPEEVRSEIQAGAELGVRSFMLWNAGSSYSEQIFNPKK